MRGKNSTWAVDWYASDEQVELMRADGIEVYSVENIVPMWAVEWGLTGAWCFVQDIWNFKPFRKD